MSQRYCKKNGPLGGVCEDTLHVYCLYACPKENTKIILRELRECLAEDILLKILLNNVDCDSKILVGLPVWVLSDKLT
jgi:hypothetical protein